MSDYLKPLPTPSIDSVPFWEGCRRHELLLQRCDACGHILHPPAPRCPECLGTSLTWTKLIGRGRVYSFVVYRRAYHPGFENELPYVVGLVDLDEGPRLISTIVGCDPQAVRCDMPVEVVFEDVTNEATLYKFRPSQSNRKEGL